MDYQVHGGVNTFKGDIESLVAHGGVFYIYGNVGSMVQHGGITYDHRPIKADRVQIVADKMSDQERERLNDKIQQHNLAYGMNVKEILMKHTIQNNPNIK